MSEYVQPRPDQQWPRYEVFKQDKPGKPHQAVGSVHAADPDHALLNARNVFVRRPLAVSLWVVRADEILSYTVQELADHAPWADEEIGAGSLESYFLFQKTSQRRSMTFVDFVGAVEAPSAAAALRLGLERFGAEDVWVWWVVPAAAIHRSEPEDIAAWFEPAKDKTYRNQSSYGFVSARRKGKAG